MANTTLKIRGVGLTPRNGVLGVGCDLVGHGEGVPPDLLLERLQLRDNLFKLGSQLKNDNFAKM